jgi:hypothetical protein
MAKRPQKAAPADVPSRADKSRPFGRNPHLRPLPPKWEGPSPLDYDGTLEWIRDWLELERVKFIGDREFCGGEHTSLFHLNQVIRHAYLAFEDIGLEDPPEQEAEADTIAGAQNWIEELWRFARRTLMNGRQNEKIERAEVARDLRVKQWSDLAIGIDDDCKYRIFSPCPELGERVNVKKARQLDLRGKRWQKLLTCFARSADGRTATTEELVMEFGYIKKGDIGHDRAVFDEQLLAGAKKARRTLGVAIADLRRKLRDLVDTDDDADPLPPEGDGYRAAFTTRHLLRDAQRHVHFGKTQ